MTDCTEQYDDIQADTLRKQTILMIEDYADMMAELQPLLDALRPYIERTEKQENAIKRALLILGESLSVAGWEFTYRKGGTMEVYRVNGEALAGYAVAHPEVQQFITTETQTTKPSVAKSQAK